MNRTRIYVPISVLGLTAAIGAAVTHKVRASDQELQQHAPEMTGGDPNRGKLHIYDHGCGACHTIPGIRGANALVGPPLTQMGGRSFVAGVLTNTPDHLISWLKDPPAIDVKTAMPNLHLSDQEARDIAAYLYTLR